MQYAWKFNDAIHQPNIGCNVNLVDNVQYAWKSHLVVPPNIGCNVNVVYGAMCLKIPSFSPIFQVHYPHILFFHESIVKQWLLYNFVCGLWSFLTHPLVVVPNKSNIFTSGWVLMKVIFGFQCFERCKGILHPWVC
jgi:hypothetical protein